MKYLDNIFIMTWLPVLIDARSVGTKGWALEVMGSWVSSDVYSNFSESLISRHELSRAHFRNAVSSNLDES